MAKRKRALKPRYVVAVSGGVDSIVLLDMITRHTKDVVVAHVHHGIRPESDEEYEFVRSLAKKYALKFEGVRLRLGEDASEALAREKRYDFLRKIARRYKGHIITAHHADDVIETVAINLTRGTGWRGLAVFGADDIYRPLTTHFKPELVAYAREHELEWREDASNNDTSKYLRNKIRKKLSAVSLDVKLQILALWQAQRRLAVDIDALSARFRIQDRYFYTMCGDESGVEVLRSLCEQNEVYLTRPQLARALLAIKVAKDGSRYHLSRDYELHFKTRTFSLEKRKK